MTRTAIIVSSPIKNDLAALIEAGDAPRRDYFALRDMLGGDLLSPPGRPGSLYRALSKLGGNALAMAFTTWARRGDYDVVLTDHEGTGLLLALLFKLTRTRRGHVMISHYLTPAKKQLFFKLLKAHTHIDRTICYSTTQHRIARDKLGLGACKVSLVLHPADAAFWRPVASAVGKEADDALLFQAGLDLPADTPLVCSAGLEFRDYATLIEAARHLQMGAHVVIAAASPWSKRKNTAGEVDLPANVHTLSLTPLQLRALYRRAQVVAVPLFDVDFQAGSLVAYEAMACGKPVVITRTRAQAQGDIVREPETGFFVPPGNASAMALALNRLLADSSLAQRMGREARAVVERGLNLDTYLDRMAEIVREVGQARTTDPELAKDGRRTMTPQANRKQRSSIRNTQYAIRNTHHPSSVVRRPSSVVHPEDTNALR